MIRNTPIITKKGPVENLKPIHRSRLRILCGKSYYTFLRYLSWHFTGKSYAGRIELNYLPYIAASHQTPLLRKLRNVDMQLQYNKIINLSIAVKRLNGIVLRPGETFSYWKLIGNPTRSKGYKEGMILFYGGFTSGTGGGLCQLSNLIYWMTIHTPLKVIERHRHSYDVFPDSNRTQPFGSGATCVYNYRDLQIYNDTPLTYQLHLFLTAEELCGEWRSTEDQKNRYEIYEKKHRITHEYWGGYVRHNLIYKKVYDGLGAVLEDSYLTENHAIMMYQPFLTEGTGEK